MLQIVLLAAGRGTRMGGPNKLLLPFGGKTVLETTLGELLAADIGPVTVVTGHERAAVLPLLERYPVREVFNPDFGLGMTSSIQTGVRVAADDASGFVVALADQPTISAKQYRRLAATFAERLAADERAIVQPLFGGQRGNPVVFAAAYRADLLAHTAPEGCKGIVQANATHWLGVEMPDDGVLRDLDTPDDYARISPAS